VDLPKKHGRGGQSALRFARLRMEKRHNYVRKVAEMGAQLFLTSDKPNVSGIVLAGLADFKNELHQSEMFDPRLKKIVVQVVDVSYGGENGFNQAIELAAESLADVKFIQEKRLISAFMEELAKDTGKYCIGVKETLHGLEAGAVEILIVWENLDYKRITLKNPQTSDQTIVHLSKEQQQDPANLKGPNGEELEVVSSILLIDWFADNYPKFGARLEFVTDRSQEGSQFVNGFGGVGGLLRYKVDFEVLDQADEFDDEVDEDFFL